MPLEILKDDTVLGEGGFRKVYKGWLDEKIYPKNGSGSVVAVKKLDDESKQGIQEWLVYSTGLSFILLVSQSFMHCQVVLITYVRHCLVGTLTLFSTF